MKKLIRIYQLCLMVGFAAFGTIFSAHNDGNVPKSIGVQDAFAQVGSCMPLEDAVCIVNTVHYINKYWVKSCG